MPLLCKIWVWLGLWSSWKSVLYPALLVFATFSDVVIYQKQVNKMNCPVQLLLRCHHSQPAKEALSALRLVCQSSLPFTVSSFLCLKWPSGGRAQQTLLSSDCPHFQRIPWFYPHCHGLMLAVMMRCCKACSFHVLTAGMRTDTVAAQCQHFMQHTLAWILMPCCYATWDTKTNCTSLLIIYW